MRAGAQSRAASSPRAQAARRRPLAREHRTPARRGLVSGPRTRPDTSGSTFPPEVGQDLVAPLLRVDPLELRVVGALPGRSIATQIGLPAERDQEGDRYTVAGHGVRLALL